MSSTNVPILETFGSLIMDNFLSPCLNKYSIRIISVFLIWAFFLKNKNQSWLCSKLERITFELTRWLGKVHVCYGLLGIKYDVKKDNINKVLISVLLLECSHLWARKTGIVILPEFKLNIFLNARFTFGSPQTGLIQRQDLKLYFSVSWHPWLRIH